MKLVHCSRMAVKISFLWGHKHGVHATASFSANGTSWCSRNDTQIFTSVILYTFVSTSYLWHIDCLVVILKFYTVPMFLHTIRNFVNQKAFSSKHMSAFLLRKYDAISQLHHSYAKGPFCVKRLIFTMLLKKTVKDKLSYQPSYNANDALLITKPRVSRWRTLKIWPE